MHTIVRVRVYLARHDWIRWAIVAVLAAGVGWVGHQRAAAVERERVAWGATVEVVVASADLVPGGPLNVEVRSLPAAVLPRSALESVPPDARLRQYVAHGAVLTSADVASAPGPAGLAVTGSAVVGVIDPLARGASIGLAVAVASEGVTLAAVATIVGIEGEVVMIAVPSAEAPSVAAAAQLGTAALLFLP